MSLSEIAVAAFKRAGVEPPEPERVDRVGYSSVEVRAIERELRRRELAREAW